MLADNLLTKGYSDVGKMGFDGGLKLQRFAEEEDGVEEVCLFRCQIGPY